MDDARLELLWQFMWMDKEMKNDKQSKKGPLHKMMNFIKKCEAVHIPATPFEHGMTVRDKVRIILSHLLGVDHQVFLHVLFKLKETGFLRTAFTAIEFSRGVTNIERWNTAITNGNMDTLLTCVFREHTINLDRSAHKTDLNHFTKITNQLTEDLCTSFNLSIRDIRVVKCIGAEMLLLKRDVSCVEYVEDRSFTMVPLFEVQVAYIVGTLLKLPVPAALHLAYYIGLETYIILRNALLFMDYKWATGVGKKRLSLFWSNKGCEFVLPSYPGIIVRNPPSPLTKPMPANKRRIHAAAEVFRQNNPEARKRRRVASSSNSSSDDEIDELSDDDAAARVLETPFTLKYYSRIERD